MIQIWPGDFFSIENHSFMGWINHKFTCTPKGTHTWEYHFGVIADPIRDFDGNIVDWETRESIGKGPTVLRLSRYMGQVITLYRIPGITPGEAEALVRSISQIGDKGYGYSDFLQAFLDVFWLLVRFNFPPYTPSQFRFSANDEYICTEIPAFGARVIGKPIEPPDEPYLWDIPAVYIQAVEEGRLELYYKGLLRRELLWTEQL